MVAKVIEDRPTASFGLFATLDVPDKTDPGLTAWVAEGTAALVAQLRATDPAAECWSWHPDERSAGFWARRMAHETLVHRWDAEAGAGTTGAAMDPTVAADGIDEYLDVFVAVTRGLQSSPAGPSFHYDCTDTGDSWFLQLPSAGTRVITREPVECAVRFRGPAEGLASRGVGSTTSGRRRRRGARRHRRPEPAERVAAGDVNPTVRLYLGMDRGSVGRNARWSASVSARSTAKRASATRAAAWLGHSVGNPGHGVEHGARRAGA